MKPTFMIVEMTEVWLLLMLVMLARTGSAVTLHEAAGVPALPLDLCSVLLLPLQPEGLNIGQMLLMVTSRCQRCILILMVKCEVVGYFYVENLCIELIGI